MEILLAFVIGYATGAKAGPDGYGELVSSVKDVRDSQEFRALVALMRAHAGAALRQLGDMVAERPASDATEGVLRRVQRLMGGAGATSPSS